MGIGNPVHPKTHPSIIYKLLSNVKIRCDVTSGKLYNFRQVTKMCVNPGGVCIHLKLIHKMQSIGNDIKSNLDIARSV